MTTDQPRGDRAGRFDRGREVAARGRIGRGRATRPRPAPRRTRRSAPPSRRPASTRRSSSRRTTRSASSPCGPAPGRYGSGAAAQRRTAPGPGGGCRRRAIAVLVLPIDIPQINLGLLGLVAALAADEGPLVAIVPDRHGRGTNALLLKPPDVIDLLGGDSRDAHVGAARPPGRGSKSLMARWPSTSTRPRTCSSPRPRRPRRLVADRLGGRDRRTRRDRARRRPAAAHRRGAGRLYGRFPASRRRRPRGHPEGGLESRRRHRRPDDDRATSRGRRVCAEFDRDPRQVELVLREAKRVVRMENGLVITETPHGFVRQRRHRCLERRATLRRHRHAAAA